MTEYQGYRIEQNIVTKKWEIFWKTKKVGGDFEREADAEEWLEDQIPLHRF